MTVFLLIAVYKRLVRLCHYYEYDTIDCLPRGWYCLHGWNHRVGCPLVVHS